MITAQQITVTLKDDGVHKIHAIARMPAEIRAHIDRDRRPKQNGAAQAWLADLEGEVRKSMLGFIYGEVWTQAQALARATMELEATIPGLTDDQKKQFGQLRDACGWFMAVGTSKAVQAGAVPVEESRIIKP